MPVIKDALVSSSTGLVASSPTTVAECACCAANTLAIVKLRKLNTICIACCCLLGIGTISVSTYFVYKLWKLNKKLNDLESDMKSLAAQFDLLDEIDEGEEEENLEHLLSEDEDVENEDDEEENVKLDSFMPRRKQSALSVASSTASDILTGHTSRILNKVTNRRASNLIQRHQIAIKTPESAVDPEMSYSPRSEHSSSQLFATPATSPERYRSNTSLSSSYTSNGHYMPKQVDNTDKYVFASYDDLKQMCQQAELEYKQNESDLFKMIDYIKALYFLAEKETNSEAVRELKFKSNQVAKKCIELYPDAYLSHKWYALSVSCILDYLGINEKIKNGFDFKKHLDEAISRNGDDYLLYYLRGRWCFKMCNLSWAERSGLKLIFGKVPNITLNDAMENFEQVEKLYGNRSKGNLLHLAKCLIAKNDVQKAVAYLKQAGQLPNKTKDHEADSAEIASLLKKYS